MNEKFPQHKVTEEEYQVEDIRDKILLLENVDFVYDEIKMPSIDIKDHEENDKDDMEEIEGAIKENVIKNKEKDGCG